jgi:hypothetical protein
MNSLTPALVTVIAAVVAACAALINLYYDLKQLKRLVIQN